VAVKINIDIEREFDVPADLDTVFALLSDVPESASHFPKVDQLTDLGDNTFRWEMEKVGIDKHAIQTVYACKYVSDADSGKITWTPIKGDGNGIVSGDWTLTENDEGTHIVFNSEAEMTLPLPGLLKLAISPVVKHEFTSMVDTYVENLKNTFSA